MVGAYRPDKVHLRGTAHSRDFRPERLGDLHGEGPDPSSRTSVEPPHWASCHDGARCHGKRQMSSTPLVAWEFEFPSGSAIFPSITIGVFQCPPPQARFASCTPVSDRYTRSPPPGAYTNRRVSATTGLVPALRLLHAGCSWPLVNRHAAVPPPSAANNQVPVALRSTAGALNRPPPLGVDTTCPSPPWCAVAPLIAPQSSTRISPSFPLCAINPPPSRTGDVDPTSVSLASSAAVLVGV